MTLVQHLIDGAWRGQEDRARRNPANQTEVVNTSPSADAGTVHDAISAAEQAASGWASTPAPARGAILLDAAELLRTKHSEIARDLVREEGKTLAEATGEVRRAIDVLRYFGARGWHQDGSVFPSASADTTVLTRQEPLGVVGLITPWNFPIAIPAWKLAPALIAGNAVVLKPAEFTPASADHLARALLAAGLPDGVLNVVHGAGEVAGKTLVEDDRVAAVSFTGSTDVGMRIQRTVTERRGRVQLEMGGKNAYLVLDDAAPEAAARVVAAGAFGLTGQACTATSRVYCTPGVRAEFSAALATEAKRYQPGDGLATGTAMGPVISEQQLATDVGAVRTAIDNGATVVTGGADPDGLRFEPTVLTDMAQDADVVRQEVFGPVLAVLPVADLDEGLARVNDSPYGLAAGICTRDLAAAHHFAAATHVGVVKVNRPTTGLDLNVPFGGVKDSSTNTFREQGPTATEFYSWSKTVYFGHDR
ncbi:aldehyde dehydrogenase (NAD+) [Tamaricihabitans halophyticus]|uniref:Aldehyde dehydrogenase (NAD+) n=1 Tax=Tamaricihabitans halophyticus TaxID=1262583 RepID=A0A4R2PZU8_9PSEU|nr:aldehyde dehydrogenase (NAD+) [Tamaricihabitans halophyticus]